MSERLFRSNRPEYPHPVRSELENSGIRVAVGDCSVTDRRRLIKPAKLNMCTQKHYKYNEDGGMAPGMSSHGSVPLSHSENVVTRIAFQQQPLDITKLDGISFHVLAENWKYLKIKLALSSFLVLESKQSRANK